MSKILLNHRSKCWTKIRFYIARTQSEREKQVLFCPTDRQQPGAFFLSCASIRQKYII